MYNDPEAAHLCFNADWPVIMAPLNVTHKLQLRKPDMKTVSELGPVGKYVSQITEFYIRFHEDLLSLDCMYIHDPTAILYIIAPELFTKTAQCHVDVETKGDFTRGVCVADLERDLKPHKQVEGRSANVKVLLEVDEHAAFKVLYDRWASFGKH